MFHSQTVYLVHLLRLSVSISWRYHSFQQLSWYLNEINWLKHWKANSQADLTTHGCRVWLQSGSDLGLFQIRFQYILARWAKMYWNLVWKSPRFVPFWISLAYFRAWTELPVTTVNGRHSPGRRVRGDDHPEGVHQDREVRLDVYRGTLPTQHHRHCRLPRQT